MKKGMKQQKKKILKRSLIVSILTLLVAGVGYYLFQAEEKPKEKVEASSLVLKGEFGLEAYNRWDGASKVSYAELKWDPVDNLTQGGYRLFQSVDGNNWDMRSTRYGKAIKVLNVYPDREDSNNLKAWMDGLELKADDGTNLIQVTAEPMQNFNSNPSGILKDPSGAYKYDVIMFGTWDGNNDRDLAKNSYDHVVDFIKAGKGVLLGHDTYTAIVAGSAGHVYFSALAETYLGITRVSNQASRVGSARVKITNNGYMMKYPFEFQNDQTFTIPATHTVGTLLNPNNATLWMDFMSPLGFWWNGRYDFGGPNISDSRGISNYYLGTKDNVGTVMTGHSNGQSTLDERKIIANVLYNLAQVTLENSASDYSVKDDQAPKAPTANIRCGSTNKFNVKVDAEDQGKEYQWYVEAATTTGTKTSDRVKETITSNIAGYFYEISSSPTSNLTADVEAKKDTYGRIDESEYASYVAPKSTDANADATTYETAGEFTIEENTDSKNYLHIVAVDRANNVSAVSSQQIKDLMQPVDFQVERTADEAKLINLELDASIDEKMKSIEIQVPKNTEIKDFASLTLPNTWYSFENSETDDYYSFSFAMENNNSLATIQDFLEALRFTIKNPVNSSGSIKVILHEKVYTSWIDENGVAHYYVFMPEMTAPGKTWFQAYNSAKQLRYKGLTGYLTTITSEEEHDFIFYNIARDPGWLGGSRGVLKNGDRINDEATVAQSRNDYDIDQDEWYWVNGPESGQNFFIGKRRADGGETFPGAYSSFNVNEPNNTNNELGEPDEYVLQFAQQNSKLWNDLPGNLGYSVNNHGYYVEFSAYGGQTEREEITDVCWNAAIPQKVSLKAYDDRGTALAQGDILYDQQLRIGNKITVQEKELELYSFIKAVDMSDAEKTSYTVSNTYQEGKLIYSIRRADLHVRQLIQNPNDELVVPIEGYLTIQNQLYNGGNPALDANYQVNTTVYSGKEADEPDFTTVVVSTSQLTNDNDEVQLSAIIPEFYKYNGYRISDTQAANSSAPLATDAKISLSRLGIYNQGERWITIYLEPNGTNDGKPQPYSWDYKKNNLGEIKTK